MLKQKYYRQVIEVTLIVVVFLAVRFWTHHDVASGLAPNINASMLNGKAFDLYQHKTRPLIIHFWAEWCPVCELEHSNIENISKDYFVMTIAMQSGDDGKLNQFLQDKKLSFNVINDEGGLLSKLYNIKGVPASFIINKNNEIEFVELGYTTELGLRMRLWWAGL